jgi:hypothetical protein
MGCERQVLWRKYADLCKQISARYQAERRRKHEERVANMNDKIRQAVFIYHEEGLYPGSKRISKVLGDPHLQRSKEGLEPWRLTLEELGYPTGHLKKYT